ncbi:MAG: OstA-like protein [Bacteroidota bacterium]
MMVRLYTLLTLGLAGFAIPLAAQSGRPVELRSARQLNVRTVAGEEVRDFVGNVHFVQPSEGGGLVQMWCDRAQQYTKQGRIELTGNVKIIQDSVTLRGKQGTYFSRTRNAVMLAGVTLERDDMTLTALQGYYDADARKARFFGEVVVVDSVSTTRCDSLTYFEQGDRTIAMGRVSIVSPRDRMTVFGDSLVHFGDIDYTIIPKNPRMVHADSVAWDRIDTLVVVGRTMESYRDTSVRYIVKDSVLLARNDLSARSGYAGYWPADGLAVLMQQPVVWYAENQITGDSVAITMENQRLRRVYVSGKAMAVSRPDTSLPDRFDQLTGRELTLFFGGDKLERIEAIRNAISLYYLFDVMTPNGVNRSSGDRVIVQFTDGQVDEITVHGGVEGTYRPEDLVARRERTLNLDGFRWHGFRPKRLGAKIVLE